MQEEGSTFNSTISLKQHQCPLLAMRNPIYNCSNNKNNSKFFSSNNPNSSKHLPVKLQAKPASGTIQPMVKAQSTLSERQSNAFLNKKPTSSHKKDILKQMNQVIVNSSKAAGNSTSIYPPIYNFKTIPRNPFKNTQITSIKNVVFPEHKPQSTPSLTKEYNSLARSVREYAYSEDMNAEHRKTMEDFHKIIDSFCGDHFKGLFSIYDGHGGTEPVKYICDRLPEIFSKFLYETNFNVEKSFIFSFQKVDDEIKCFSQSENVGCTATVVFIFKEYDTVHGNRRVLYTANVGDSRGVLIRENEVTVLTTEHKCSNEAELERIKEMGGIVFNSRLFGQLALSRALGDHSMKNNGLICTPAIHKHFIDDKDQFVIIASDGIWDTVSNRDLIKLLSPTEPNDTHNQATQISAESLCKSIISKALEKGSYDNISCIAIKL